MQFEKGPNKCLMRLLKWYFSLFHRPMHHVLEITFIQLLSLSNAEKAQNASKVCLLQAGQHSFEFTQSFFFFFFYFLQFGALPSLHLDRMRVVQSKRIVFQRSSAACGNRAVKRVWMTEACTLVSLLIVVCCLHAFGPHTTAMAWGSLTASPWVSGACWKGTLFQGPAVWRSADYVCFSWMGTQGSHSPSLSACVCVVMCVSTYVLGQGGEGGCYNNKLGSSVTLNSPIFQEESKQSWLLLHICAYYKCMQVSRVLQGSPSPLPQGL